MQLIIKILYYVVSKIAYWHVVLPHWFWVRHYKGRLSLNKYKISDLPLTFKLDLKSHIQVDENVNFAGTSKLLAQDGGVLKIGRGTFVNANCSFNSLKEISIGDHCLFGESVKIYDHNHRFNAKDLLVEHQGYSLGKVSIGNHCWIGSNVVILKGVSIGDHVVIGAGCVVNMDIPNNTLVTLHEAQMKLSEIKFK
ncbi:acyltransferase [Mangrovimonas sp. DI 80]|uniref:acyltransferase n=1 Tax=Mangrovimonas sp. DI 80 TaxID=1779330 RepID=UPI000976D69F|nr:acyltransferase [Mangrovimonas sp. DI 80]OMP31783.1 hypothetical protein BKM32_01605 [Mangrovimonas sp. DI 80]